ncbi:MAG: sensor histidine kinase [Micropepsaceae bacterium]
MRKSFIIALILVVVPFALVMAGQAVWRLVRSHEAARDTLVAAAVASTREEANILAGAETLLRSMESQQAVRTAGPDCDDTLAAAIDGLSYVSNMSRLDATGRVLCSARPVAEAVCDRSGQVWWGLLQARRAFIVSEQHAGASTGKPVLTAAIPLTTTDGAPDGALALGITVDVLAGLMRDRRLPEGALAALVDRDGKVIAATNMELAIALFRSPEADGTLMRSNDPDGRRWLIALAPIAAGDLQIAFAEQESALFTWSYIDVAATIGLPLVMAAVIFVAIWYAANRLVLRWITYLERVARAYGKGHFALKPAAAAAEAPPEIRTLAGAMGEMAENIRQRDASLRHALEQRTLMLREIHHRVKNNLQIVGSLLQIEARGVKEPAAQAALKLTQTRINAIALAHRALEEVGAQTVVNVNRLLTDLAQMLHDAFSAQSYAEGVTVKAPDLLVETDIAVPLALLLVEQIGAIARGAIGAGQDKLNLNIEAASDGTALSLSISYEAAGDGAAPKLSAFAEAYLRQLRAHHTAAREGSRAEARFVFPQRTAFSEAQPH